MIFTPSAARYSSSDEETDVMLSELVRAPLLPSSFFRMSASNAVALVGLFDVDAKLMPIIPIKGEDVDENGKFMLVVEEEAFG